MSNKLILVVNDDVTQLNILSGLLENNGFYTESCQSVEEALSLIGRENPPDLIVTDLYMPKIDGWKFCRLLRSPEYKEFNEVPVLVVSATFSGEESSRITADLGANGFLSSPVDGEKFLNIVKNLIKGREPKEKLKILIVEDSRSQAQFVKESFLKNGATADIAEDIKTAKTYYNNYNYDVAVIDYYLPDGKGDVLLKEFLSIKSDSVCIMMTTDPDPDLSIKWMKLGAAAYMLKPFKSEYLIELCMRARRERLLLRVEEILEKRTAELRKSEKRLAEAHYLAGLGSFVWEPKSGSTEWSRGLLNLLKYDNNQKSESFSIVNDLCFQEDKKNFFNWLNKGIDSGKDELSPEEFRFVRQDGEIINILAAGRVEKSLGESRVIFVTVYDITNLKEAEEKRVYAEKSESLARMSAAVAHNFNNYLAVALGSLELLGDDLPKDSLSYECLSKAMESTEKAVETSTFMLTYLGQSPGRPEDCDISEICLRKTEEIKKNVSGKVSISTDFPEPGPVVKIDPVQLGTALNELVKNSLDSFNEGGEIRIQVSISDNLACYGKNYFPRDWKPKKVSYACISVTDNGGGISPEKINKIFDPFYTDKFTGRGIGLASVIGIVKAADGVIFTESEVEKGSTFYIMFPVS
jgi:DNA-binding response OmpR family regulator/two-component sensor histidine kinase